MFQCRGIKYGTIVICTTKEQPFIHALLHENIFRLTSKFTLMLIGCNCEDQTPWYNSVKKKKKNPPWYKYYVSYNTN